TPAQVHRAPDRGAEPQDGGVIALVVAAAVAALPASDPASRKTAVDQSVAEVLKGESFQFCHDEKYPLYGDERGWCPLLSDPNSACPSLPRACKGVTLGATKPREQGAGGDDDGKLERREREQP